MRRKKLSNCEYLCLHWDFLYHISNPSKKSIAHTSDHSNLYTALIMACICNNKKDKKGFTNVVEKSSSTRNNTSIPNKSEKHALLENKMV